MGSQQIIQTGSDLLCDEDGVNIQYIANFPVKGCLFCGYATGYVINSVGLREIFASSQLHGCVSSVFTYSYFSIAVDSVVHDGRKRPQL